jgi:Putative peptidoglycan binding domain
MATSTARRSLLAMASVTTGLGTMLASGTAHAAPPTDRTTQSQADQAPDSSVALATCWSWNDYHNVYGQVIHFPSVTREGDINCVLGLGNATDGVYKLQDALNRCYGAGLVQDGIYGPATRGAVVRVQQYEGIPADGVYGPQTRGAMKWPVYNADGSFDRCTRPSVLQQWRT